jgi:hypothetical protein
VDRVELRKSSLSLFANRHSALNNYKRLIMNKKLKTHRILLFVLIVSLFSLESLQAQKKSDEINYLEYVRVYTDSLGESHFEDLKIDLNEIDFAPPAPPIFTSNMNPSSNYGFISVLPGWKSEWHPTPKRQFVFYLSGIIEAEVSDGEVRQFGPGSITLIEDTTGKGHKSYVIGSEKVIGVVIQLEE